MPRPLLVGILVTATLAACEQTIFCDAIACLDGVELGVDSTSFRVELTEYACGFRCAAETVLEDTCSGSGGAVVFVSCTPSGATISFQDTPPTSLAVLITDVPTGASFTGTLTYDVQTRTVGAEECRSTCDVGQVDVTL